MFILDTNVVSELRRANKANPRVREWAASVPLIQFFLTATIVFELERGALSIARRDKAQGLILRTWIDEQILKPFSGRIFSVDVAVAQCCARMHVPNPRAERDAFIAATALVHGMTVVTRNVGDFAATGARVFNPWGE